MRESIIQPSASPGSGSATRETVAEIGEGNLGQPHWAGCYLNDWEILVYEKGTFWEACFFKWGSHHEHVKAFSLMAARRRAVERIDILENRQRAKGRPMRMLGTIAAATSSSSSNLQVRKMDPVPASGLRAFQRKERGQGPSS